MWQTLFQRNTESLFQLKLPDCVVVIRMVVWVMTLDIELPHVPRHEFFGTVESIEKNVKNFHIGYRVTVPFVCKICGQSISVNHQVCDHQSQPGFTHWGSFAEYVALDYADINLVKLPKEINYITAVLLGCQFLTLALGHNSLINLPAALIVFTGIERT
jgi:D-arabinose 1-dehydrogenase-like Zn-dependent alcohol dehydrogenase